MKINKVLGYSLSTPFESEVKYYGYKENVKNIGIIEVHTDNGYVGFGETYAGVYCSELITPVVNYLSKYLIGYNLDDNLDINNLPFIGRSGLIKSVYSGIEIAIFDILSKSENKSLSDFLAVNQPTDLKYRVYASNGSAMFSPNQIEEDVKDILSKGFTAYKMRIGVQEKEVDIKRLNAARKTLGSNNILMVDAIMGSNPQAWDMNDTLQWTKILEDLGVYWLEEPFPPNQVSNYQKLKEKSSIKIAGGESLNQEMEFDLYQTLKAVDIIQPDISNGGGIKECISVINKFGNENTAIHVWGSQIALNVSSEFSKVFQPSYLEVPMMKLEINELIKCAGAGIGIHISQGVKDKYIINSEFNFEV